MSATKRRIALEIVATDTHCGDGEMARCAHSLIGGGCGEFRQARDYDTAEWEFIRLPECIAAEKAQGGGGGE